MLTGGKNVIPHAVRDVADAAAAFSARIGPDRHFDSQEKVEEALAECCSPQNVTVIGMTGSGKSSTLDALAGERFCSRVSSEATLVRWQYRPHPAPHTHEWVLDLFYPSDALLNLAPALLAAGAAVPAEQALPLYIRDKVAQTTAERSAAGLAR